MKTITTTVRLPESIAEELDAWREKQIVKPTRTATILEAIRQMIREKP